MGELQHDSKDTLFADKCGHVINRCYDSPLDELIGEEKSSD